MNNKILQILVRFVKENNLYNLNDEIQRNEIHCIAILCKQKNYASIIRRLYNVGEACMFNYKKKITQFEEFLFEWLFNKTPTGILDEYLINNDLYDLFYKTLKELDKTIDLTYGVGKTIDYSFFWDETEEGLGFWDKENEKLKKYINNLIIENIK